MPKIPDDQWPTDDPVLASLAGDLRIVASGPAPEPRPGLVAAMRRGPVLVDPPAAGRKKMLVKTLLGGLVAKVAMGVGVATASVAAAGAAGVLPDPAQHAVASVVAATTPFALPDPSDVTTFATEDEPGGATTTTSSSTSTTTTLAGGGEEAGGGTGTRAVNHGLCVSTAAQDKSGEGNHGKTVSSVARSDCGKTTTTVAGGSTTTTTIDDGRRSANSRPGSSGDNGRGSSGSSGNSGNSGRGSSGRG
jgi:hypothetical protein